MRMLSRILVTLPFFIGVLAVFHVTGFSSVQPTMTGVIAVSLSSIPFAFSDRMLRTTQSFWLATTGVPRQDIVLGLRVVSLSTMPWRLRRNRRVFAAFLMLAWRMFEPNADGFSGWSTPKMMRSATMLSEARAQRAFDIEHLAELIDRLSAYSEVSATDIQRAVRAQGTANTKMVYFRAATKTRDVADALENGIPVEYMVTM